MIYGAKRFPELLFMRAEGLLKLTELARQSAEIIPPSILTADSQIALRRRVLARYMQDGILLL